MNVSATLYLHTPHFVINLIKIPYFSNKLKIHGKNCIKIYRKINGITRTIFQNTKSFIYLNTILMFRVFKVISLFL